MRWPLKRLELLASSERYSFVGGPFGSKLTTRDYVDEGVPVIRGSNLNNGRYLDLHDFVYVSDSKVRDDLSSNLAKPLDVIFTQRGTLGQVAIVPEEGISDRYVVSQSQMKLTVDPAKADRLFLYYFFSNRETKEKLVSYASSSGVPHINLTVLRNFEVPVPPLRTQQRIASILSAYDDLIENNRRRIQLLERAARLLYKEWFVHLRFPGQEHTKIIDGLPEGWEFRPLSTCTTFQSGGTPSKSKSEFWTGNIPWISSGEVTGIRLSTSKHHVTEAAVQSGSRYAEVGTILGVVRGMSLAKEFRLGLVAKRVCFNQDLKAFVPDRGIESLYLFHALDEQRDRIRQQAGEASHGTKKLETAVLENLRITVPIPPIRQHFVEYVSKLHAQMDVLIQQNEWLEHAFDLLLPRLMSGELAA